ncbi:uncharacterized protein LOC116321082 [Oreochromis aureus]|uniref:uncharacterized protein LOC116321082 n=1 Tax=Oreochromis aureus TaxID=47969 RepID=UPI0019547F47|nr:uncharacterized protein LOC116321082 [Oreochromis aureus]XP_039463943.1 uncharacterized protein LOC116321082 [Oreochromis aureus]XP_039463944.1 uncharacterized protein LOC116321082 [Oreochromis aureus]XP_039463945.1 uncharacterized protein LOC116321082 [Oreochromis aureus]XP_039463946.1 uncharacterized protein LOC116321082 [Oreochromis aureus]CAI5660223.1 unnamed protein product [Mustela putorius furo]
MLSFNSIQLESMERARLLSHCWALLFLHSSLTAAADLVNITAESGQNVTLSCRANNNNLVTFLEWSKNGLRKGYLLLYRDERFDLENQHPSFKNRVELQDRQMKDGDVSLILKDVTLDDRGSYECRVETKMNRKKRANQDDDPVIIISLNVVPPGQPGGDEEDGDKKGQRSGNSLLIAAVPTVLVFGVLAVLIYRKHKRQIQGPDEYQPPAEVMTI